MCIICNDASCDHGEKCGLTKIYKKKGSASAMSGQKAEWENVIPGAVIRGSKFLQKQGVTYNDSMTYALDYYIHRNAVDGGGGGITSTGKSITAQDWVNHLIKLFDSGNSDNAVEIIFCDEVHAIKAGRIFNSNDYSSLAAVLGSYIDKGIVSRRKADEIASWMYKQINSSCK